MPNSSVQPQGRFNHGLIRVASWRTSLLAKGRGAAKVASHGDDDESGPMVIEVGLEADEVVELGISTGSRQVDLRMVHELPWIARIVRLLEAGAGLAPNPCGKGVQRLLRWVPAVWITVQLGLGTWWVSHTTMPMAIVLGTVAALILLGILGLSGVRTVQRPCNREILHLIELRARSHLKLSATESSDGTTSLTQLLRLLALLVVFIGPTVPVIMLSFATAEEDDTVMWVVGGTLAALSPFAFDVFLSLLTLERWVTNIQGPTGVAAHPRVSCFMRQGRKRGRDLLTQICCVRLCCRRPRRMVAAARGTCGRDREWRGRAAGAAPASARVAEAALRRDRHILTEHGSSSPVLHCDFCTRHRPPHLNACSGLQRCVWLV